ncbi:MAG: pyruvate, phosphate dikinase [Alphaproteobacteria bacterium]|nr:pyruvate, phosphate dikinase [Alphaproteobacteria bacterium]
MSKWVYGFGAGQADGDASMKALLGGKGANLAEMSGLGLAVPPGLTITTEVCSHYYANAKTYPKELEAEVERGLQRIEETVGAGLGDPRSPLLLSVRSGAPVSMPGMMDTVLNLGLNDDTVEGLAAESDDARFAKDSYRRFIQMYGDVVLGVDHYLFEDQLDQIKRDRGLKLDNELSPGDLDDLIARYQKIVLDDTGEPFPQDVQAQLWGAIGAVFSSWMTPRAITYRRLHDIGEKMGTAVNVQAMVFGNRSDDSATGVAFTRDPSTGERRHYGEFLINAQGEDVVAGIRTPQPLTTAMKEATRSDLPAMEEVMPEAFAELAAVFDKLEAHYRDMQDVEFTIQDQRLWILQTRAGKRTTPAALKVAVDMANEGLITQDEAVGRIDPASLDQLLHPSLDPDAPREVLAKGLPASPGAVSGQVVFDSDEAEKLGTAGAAVILVRVETSPEDIHGMHAAKGILTARGGMTSHAAVVARGMGKACVSAAVGIEIDYAGKCLQAGGHEIKAGEIITIDGGAGEVMLGAVPTIDPVISDDFATLMGWADARRTLKVRANAETPEDARTARSFGAEGIGLSRTEHMFFDDDRIVAMREMILSETTEGRRAALAKILPMQRADFVELFEIMAGCPVTIRLLDPPLHEFLPHEEDEIEQVAEASGIDPKALRRRARELKESNPMLGFRGCRLGILFPEIYEMQARAIFEAAIESEKKTGDPVVPEVMVPLIGSAREFDILKAQIDKVAAAVIEETGGSLFYQTGTMIEVPRAALQAGEIAKTAEFFSFGTNDLTQMTLGLSRDDSAKFLEPYIQQGIYPTDPFSSIDVDGVGVLVKLAAEQGRAARPGIKLGICGEHGGDPASVAFCHKVGLDYVSCSPYRVPIARLAAAQSAARGSLT